MDEFKIQGSFSKMLSRRELHAWQALEQANHVQETFPEASWRLDYYAKNDGILRLYAEAKHPTIGLLRLCKVDFVSLFYIRMAYRFPEAAFGLLKLEEFKEMVQTSETYEGQLIVRINCQDNHFYIVCNEIRYEWRGIRN
ncbi:MAG TPA: hypothetical protein VKU00_10650 [Chthonomonadaceae bacterium]|nr:hypothetical protein [Chthonomonadaceae bacterium]